MRHETNFSTILGIAVLFGVQVNLAAETPRTVVLDEIRNARQNAPVVADIWLALPDHPQVGLLACEAEYTCPTIEYSLQRVDADTWASTTAALDALSSKPFANCVDVENDHENGQTQTYCSFVRVLDAINGLVSPPVSLPHDWFAGEQLIKLWIEGAARVTSKGLPLAKSDFVRPVAAVTDKGAYVVCESRHAPLEFAHELYIAGQRAFSLTERPTKVGIAHLMTLFIDEFAKQLGSEPLLAAHALDTPPTAGEWIAARQRLKSHVLGGSGLLNVLSSAYEISTYTLKWYSTDTQSFVPTAEHLIKCKGAEGCLGRYIVVSLDHVLLVSADGVNYRDNTDPPSRMQLFMSRYRESVSKAFDSALRATCGRLEGEAMMTRDACEIRRLP
jgi:hypothetical protein